MGGIRRSVVLVAGMLAVAGALCQSARAAWEDVLVEAASATAEPSAPGVSDSLVTDPGPLAADPGPLVTDPAPIDSRISLPTSPDWRRYGYVEALIMGRDNQSFNRPLVTNLLESQPFLTSQSPQFPFGGGVRLFTGAVGPDCRGWEVGYFGLYNLTAAATTSAAAVGEPLYMPDALGLAIDAAGADVATITYRTTINSAEANVFHHFERWNDYRSAWLEVDWLAGFRYVGVEDSANIGLVCCNGTEFPSYRVGTSNNMFGGQVGGRARWNWQRWAIETWGKAGILGNLQSQYQSAVLDETGALVRDARSSTGTAAGMIADINVSTIYRLTDTWGIRAGYNLIWLGGIAQAANQFDFGPGAAAGTLLQPSGSIFLQGANLGLEARW